MVCKCCDSEDGKLFCEMILLSNLRNICVHRMIGHTRSASDATSKHGNIQKQDRNEETYILNKLGELRLQRT